VIPEDHKDAIITNGLHFMRSITEAYGADEGMRLWETIANTLDGDVKGQIFFAMITGTHNNRIVLKRVGANTDRVARIKEIRNWTILGLKEAKDVSDMAELGKPTSITVKPQEYGSAVVGLRKVGFEI
jgi:ribosomal protein L7/L12